MILTRIGFAAVLMMQILFVGVAASEEGIQQKQIAPWSEFSFILKPSPVGGIGVFAAHDMRA